MNYIARARARHARTYLLFKLGQTSLNAVLDLRSLTYLDLHVHVRNVLHNALYRILLYNNMIYPLKY
jgi:hypothetical protein